MPSVLALRFSAAASQESVVRLEQTSFRELTASVSCEERPGKVSSSRLLDDLRCSRPTTIDMMTITGVHSTHPLHGVDADYSSAGHGCKKTEVTCDFGEF